MRYWKQVGYRILEISWLFFFFFCRRGWFVSGCVVNVRNLCEFSRMKENKKKNRNTFKRMVVVLFPNKSMLRYMHYEKLHVSSYWWKWFYFQSVSFFFIFFFIFFRTDSHTGRSKLRDLETNTSWESSTQRQRGGNVDILWLQFEKKKVGTERELLTGWNNLECYSPEGKNNIHWATFPN